MSITGVSSAAHSINTQVQSQVGQTRPAIKPAGGPELENRSAEAKVSQQQHRVSRKQEGTRAEERIDGREKQKEASEEEVISAIETANDALKAYNKRFEYKIHDDTKRIMVKIVNPDTDEIIKEIPSEKVLDMVAKIWEMSGVLIDEKS